MSETRVLVLGGTAEARELAAALHAGRIPVVSSLAGRVSRPRLPVGQVRIGGFGGATALAQHVRDGGFTHMVAATHPFAARITANAKQAAEQTGVPLVRLARPGWQAHPDSGTWTWVNDVDDARKQAERLGARPFITTGRQTLGHFESWTERDVLVRVVEPLHDVPSPWTVVLDRGPYVVEGEAALMRAHGVDVLLTKDSGGGYTSAKLEAARELGVPVVVVRRPDTPAGMRELSDVNSVVEWVLASV